MRDDGVVKICRRHGELRESDVVLEKRKIRKCYLLCKECEKFRRKKYRVSNKEILLVKNKIYRTKNIDKKLIWEREYREKNRERLIAYRKKYKELTKEHRRKVDKLYIEKLGNGYVLKLIISGTKLSRYDIPDKFLALYKLFLKLKRGIKKCQQKTHKM